jgi:ATP-binding cassette, subfamily C, bacterial CydD
MGRGVDQPFDFSAADIEPSGARHEWLKREAAAVSRLLLLAVSLGLAAGVLLILQAGLLSAVLHAVVFENRGISDLLLQLTLLPLLMLGRFGLLWAGENCGFEAALRVKADLRLRLYEHLQRLGPQWLRGRSSGELAHQVVDAVEGLEGYFARFLPQAALAVLIPAAVLAFVFPLSWVAGLILLGTAPFIPLMMVLIGSQAEKLSQRQWRRLADLSARFLDSLQGLPTLRAFNAARRETQVIAQITDAYRITTLSVLRVAFLSALVLEFLATMGVAMAAVYIGFRLLYGQMVFQGGFFILLLAPEFYLPLRTLGTHYHARLSAAAAAEGLMAILNEPPGSGAARPDALRPVWSSLGLRLVNLGFAYPGGRAVVSCQNLEIPAGSFTVIAGPSGAGKTTLLRLLLGSLVPGQGRILVNQTELAAVDQRAWLAHVAWMPQAATIFQGTVLENMLCEEDSDPAARQRCDRAAALTLFDRDLAGLPQGWDTPLGEGGEGLSGGQARRLALTRAVAKEAPLILLDEPTAHLDADARQSITAVLRGLAGMRTLVVASHDPAVLAMADHVHVLSAQGRPV